MASSSRSPAPKRAVPLRDIIDRTEFAKRPAPVPLSSFWKVTVRPSTYGVIWAAAEAPVSITNA